MFITNVEPWILRLQYVWSGKWGTHFVVIQFMLAIFFLYWQYVFHSWDSGVNCWFELKMLDFSDRTRVGISIMTSAADS